MNPTVVLVAGLGIVLFLPVVWRIGRRRFDLFEPVILFVVAFGVMFVARPAAMLARHETVYYGLDVEPKLGLAVFLALVGAVGFLVGYELSLGPRLAERLPSPPDRVRVSTTTAGAVIAGGLGVIALGVALTADGIEGLRIFLGGRGEELSRILDHSSTYLWYASLLVIPAALVTIALALKSRRPVALVAATALTALAFLRTVPVGNRMFLLVFVGGVLIYLYVRGGRRPGILALAAALGLGLVLSYFLLAFRDPESRDSATSAVTQLATEPYQVFSPLLRGADAEMAPALAGALTVIPDKLDYRYGQAALGDLVLRPIPRQLWSGKPETPGQDVVAAVWSGGIEYGLDPAFSPLLVLFWDFSFVGVVVGMSVFGLCARVLYDYFLRHRSNFVAQVFFSAALWFVVLGVRNSPGDTLVYAVFILAPILIILWVTARRDSAFVLDREPARELRHLVGPTIARSADREADSQSSPRRVALPPDNPHTHITQPSSDKRTHAYPGQA